LFGKSKRNMKGTYLGEFEELVLLAVALLHDDAYGLGILDEIEAKSGRTVTISTIHSTLNRLEKKGLLTSYMGGATTARGGRSKRFFEITASGRKALIHAHKLRNTMWDGIPQAVWQVS